MLVSYRYYVRYRSASGRNLRGLYILRSETDKKRMELLGNVFTRYRYVKTGVRVTGENDRLRINSEDTGLAIEGRRVGHVFSDAVIARHLACL